MVTIVLSNCASPTIVDDGWMFVPRGSPWMRTKNGYVASCCGREREYLHRMVIRAHGDRDCEGRALRPGDEIHHRNENKLDNTYENLRVLSTSEHRRLHGGPKRPGGRPGVGL